MIEGMHNSQTKHTGMELCERMRKTHVSAKSIGLSGEACFISRRRANLAHGTQGACSMFITSAIDTIAGTHTVPELGRTVLRAPVAYQERSMMQAKEKAKVKNVACPPS
jgi:hypothetical protein